jgi:hypothetical protein
VVIEWMGGVGGLAHMGGARCTNSHAAAGRLASKDDDF